MKLADALLRRKELQQKVDQLRQVQRDATFEMRVQRRAVTDSVDDIEATVPKLTASQVTEEFDYYASRLRRIDAAIQQLNWTVDINADADVWVDYSRRNG
jgi:hypothetical protein